MHQPEQISTYEKLSGDIRDIVLTNLGITLDSSEPCVVDPLAEGRFYIGSLTAIDILTAIEQLYEIQFPNEALNPELFSSIENLSRCVELLIRDQRNVE